MELESRSRVCRYKHDKLSTNMESGNRQTNTTGRKFQGGTMVKDLTKPSHMHKIGEYFIH